MATDDHIRASCLAAGKNAHPVLLLQGVSSSLVPSHPSRSVANHLPGNARGGGCVEPDGLRLEEKPRKRVFGDCRVWL